MKMQIGFYRKKKKFCRPICTIIPLKWNCSWLLIFYSHYYFFIRFYTNAFLFEIWKKTIESSPCGEYGESEAVNLSQLVSPIDALV